MEFHVSFWRTLVRKERLIAKVLPANTPEPLKVIVHAQRVFGNSEKAERWMKSYSEPLDAKPIDLFATEEGRERVLEELARIEPEFLRDFGVAYRRLDHGMAYLWRSPSCSRRSRRSIRKRPMAHPWARRTNCLLLTPTWAATLRVSRRMGDDRLRNFGSAVLSVPSAIIPKERNYLINPEHADFPQIQMQPSKPFVFDERLWLGRE
jgi:hypothetical protein